MGDVVSLNRARKAKFRTDARATAQANRAKFGRTKAEEVRDKAEKARAEKLLAGAKLEDESR